MAACTVGCARLIRRGVHQTVWTCNWSGDAVCQGGGDAHDLDRSAQVLEVSRELVGGALGEVEANWAGTRSDEGQLLDRLGLVQEPADEAPIRGGDPPEELKGVRAQDALVGCNAAMFHARFRRAAEAKILFIRGTNRKESSRGNL